MDYDDVYAEKLELVGRVFEKTLDLETALTLVPMSDADRVRMEADEDLKARMSVARAKTFEMLVDGITTISKAENEKTGVRLGALRELGKLLRPDKFREAVSVDLAMTYKVVPRRRQESA